MTTRSTYVMVAECIDSARRHCTEQTERDALLDLAEKLSVRFHEDNSAFKRSRFLKACGFDE